MLLVFVHFLPLGNPTGQASECENHGEHVFGNSDRPVDDTAVEIDVGVELAGDEVGVRPRALLELDRDVDERVAADERAAACDAGAADVSGRAEAVRAEASGLMEELSDIFMSTPASKLLSLSGSLILLRMPEPETYGITTRF